MSLLLDLIIPMANIHRADMFSVAYCATIFIPIPIDYVMIAIHTPMIPIKLKYLFSIGTHWRVAGQAVNYFLAF